MRFFLYFSALFSLALSTTQTAQAQLIPWAMGAYGGMQMCNTQSRVASGAVSRNDEIRKYQKRVEKVEKLLEKAEERKDRADDKRKAQRRILDRAFKAEAADFLVGNHIENGNDCSKYRGYEDGSTANPSSRGSYQKDDEARQAEKDFLTKAKGKEQDNKISVPDSLHYPFLKYYCSDKGAVYYQVCADPLFVEDVASKRTSVKSCQDALKTYREAHKDYQQAETEVEQLKGELKDLEVAMDEAEDRANERAERRSRYSSTEADCVTCRDGERGRRIDGAYVGANFLTAAAATLIGGSQDRYRIQMNAQLGQPSNAAPSLISYGFPFIMNGIYGALGGATGQGGFGCAGGMNGGGYPYGPYGMAGNPYGMSGPWGQMSSPWGYPLDMYGNPLSGNMYMPGMNPWGSMNGPWGAFNPMMFPNMGGAIGGVLGGAIGTPMMGSPLMGGQMLGAPLMGGQMGSPLMGSPLGGAFGGALGGAMGMPMTGMPMSGFPMGGAIGGVLNGGMPNQQMLMLQQQMMQAQMQYQQQMMQAQMQMAQQYQVQQMQRQQQLQSLYSELYSLSYRINLIQSGGMGSGLLGGALSGGIGGALTGGIGGAVNFGFSTVGGAVNFGGYSPYSIYPPNTLNPGTLNPGGGVTVPGRGR